MRDFLKKSIFPPLSKKENNSDMKNQSKSMIKLTTNAPSIRYEDKYDAIIVPKVLIVLPDILISANSAILIINRVDTKKSRLFLICGKKISFR